MDFGANKMPVEMHLEVFILETFILVLRSQEVVQEVMERIQSVEKYWSEILLFRLSWCQCQYIWY